MTSRDFAYWLQGYFEITDPQTITQKEVEVIKNHLNLVFIHEIDPSLNKGLSIDQIDKLNAVHSGKKSSDTLLRC